MTLSALSQEQKALLVGFALILLVVGGSLFRWYRNTSSSDTSSSAIAPADKALVTQNKRDPLIHSEELQQRLSQPDLAKKTLLLDTRDPKEFQAQHIANATNIASDTLNGAIPSVHPDDLLIVLIGTAQNENHLRTVALQVQGDGLSAAVLQGGFDAWIAASGSYISAGDTSSFVDASKVITITPDQAKQLFDSQSPLFAFLDTRFPENFAAGHIPGALNIPLEQLENRKRDLPLGKRFIIYNDSPIPAFQSAVRVFDLGFPGAEVIDGSFTAWKTKGYPVEK
jgi:rhodanese-related sulfurtransferase